MAYMPLTPNDIPPDQRPTSASAWRFLVEMWDDGLFEIGRQDTGSYAAHLLDDGEVIPLRDMGYNKDIGLFRRSLFPHEQDDA